MYTIELVQLYIEIFTIWLKYDFPYVTQVFVSNIVCAFLASTQSTVFSLCCCAPSNGPIFIIIYLYLLLCRLKHRLSFYIPYAISLAIRISNYFVQYTRKKQDEQQIWIFVASIYWMFVEMLLCRLVWPL